MDRGEQVKHDAERVRMNLNALGLAEAAAGIRDRLMASGERETVTTPPDRAATRR